MVSIVRSTSDGETVEVDPVGRDGMVGLPVFLDAGTDVLHASAEVLPCEALRVPADTFRSMCEQLPCLRSVMGRYTSWTLTGMAQWVACARLHEAHERMARWLLMCDDRVEGHTLALTHDVLAQMLGVRRPTVTLAAGMLQKSGAGLLLARGGDHPRSHRAGRRRLRMPSGQPL